MSEEQKPLSPNPNPSEGKRQAPSRQVRRSPKSVFQYLAILFAAAFVLLLFTFAMEKRQYQIMQEQSEEQIDDLQQSSISAVNSLNNLLKENETLKEEIETLKAEIDTMKLDRNQLAETIKKLVAEQENRDKAIQALDWFWQIDEASVRGRYSSCRTLIQSIEDAGLVGYLPRESITDNGRFSPFDRYQEIKQALD